MQCFSCRSQPGTWDQQRDLLQLAFKIRWYGRVVDVRNEGMAEENRRLKKMYAEMAMQNELLKDALGKKP